MKKTIRLIAFLILLANVRAIAQKNDSTQAKKPDCTPTLSDAEIADTSNVLCQCKKANIAGITTICFDFKRKMFVNGDDQKLQGLKLGQLYRVKIFNINTNLYKISIGKRDTIINTALTVPTFSGFGISDLSTLVTGLATATTISAPAQNTILDASSDMVQLKASSLSEGGYKVSYGIKALARDQHKQPPSDVDIVKLIQQAHEKKLKDLFDQLNKLKTQTDQLMNKYNRYIVQAQIENSSTDNATFFNLANTSLDDAYTNFNTIRSQIADLGDQVDADNAKYKTETSEYATLIKNTDELKKADDLLTSTYTQFSTTLGKAKDAVSSDNVLKFMTSLTAVFNNIKREYTSFPLQFSKDQNILTLSVQPRKDDSGLEPYTTSFIFPIRRHNFWAVSTGVYWSTLYNHTYSTLKTINSPTDTTYSLHSEKPKSFEFGVNAMVRYGWQIGTDEQYNYWHVGIGPGVSIADQVRARLMLGTGFAHGQHHKLVIDAGIIAGYTDQLSVLYQENKEYPLPTGTGVVAKLGFGFYSSISYLFY